MNPNIEQYSGDEALYCMNGKHAYTLGICTWCDRHEPTQVEYKPVTD